MLVEKVKRRRKSQKIVRRVKIQQSQMTKRIRITYNNKEIQNSTQK